MLQEWLHLSDAQWAIWTRAPEAETLWTFGVLTLVIVSGLALFACGVSRRRWREVVAGLVLVAPAAMLTAVFLETAVAARVQHAWCAVDGRSALVGRDACAAHEGGTGAATLVHHLVDPDGFSRVQYYWTTSGLCEARLDRRCEVSARRVEHVPPPNLTDLRNGHEGQGETRGGG